MRRQLIDLTNVLQQFIEPTTDSEPLRPTLAASKFLENLFIGLFL